MIDNSHLSPDQVVLDLVFVWRGGLMPRRGEATVFASSKRLHLCGANHRGQGFSITVPVNFDGDAVDGEAPRFVLRQLGSTVWKLSPSIAVQGVVHTYVTIVQVPEDWRP